MKFKLLVVKCFLFLLGMSGCSKESTEDTDFISSDKALMTMQTAGPQTRAGYIDTGTRMIFSWRSGDATSVVVNGPSGNKNCRLSSGTAGKNVPFSGTVTTWIGTKSIYAFYPYSATGYTVIGGDDSSTATSLLALPNPQSYTVEGPISNSFMVGVGKATASGSAIDASVSLKQVMSIIKLTISNAPGKVKGVKLKCSEPIFPTSATVKLSDGTINNPGTLVNQLSMIVSDGTSGKDKAISFAMFPSDLTGKTMKIEVTFEGGLIKSINKSGRLFERNTHYVMAFDATGAEPAIEINGLKWATGNLIADGPNDAKIGTPTDNGLYFQFGSLIGWSEKGVHKITVRPSNYNINTPWNLVWAGDPTTENTAAGKGDPCKYYLGGTWRLPTDNEYIELCNHTTTDWSGASDWTWESSTSSALHTSGLKFLAAGCRSNNNGSLFYVGSKGFYQSSTPSNSILQYSFNLNFSSSILNPNYCSTKALGYSVRCVRD